MMKPILLGGASLAVVLSLSGCAAPSVGYPRSPASVLSAAAHLPPGFADSDGDGLAVKAVDTVNDACQPDIGTCFQVLVYATRDCDVYAAVNGLDASGAIVDSANDTATLNAGDTARLTFQFSQTVARLEATALGCT